MKLLDCLSGWLFGNNSDKNNGLKLLHNYVKCESKPWTKPILKYHSYQTNGILFYFTLTFGQVPQNATNDRSNYESVEIEPDDI